MPTFTVNRYKILVKYRLAKFKRHIKSAIDLRKIGLKYNIIKYIFQKDYRETFFQKRREYYRKKRNDLGYFSTETSPKDLFNEMLFDKVYDFKDFVPKKGDVVVDVGAYYGDSAIWWAKEFGANVIAFEPLKEAYNEVIENAKLNKVDDKIKVYNIALGDGEKIWGGKGLRDMFNSSNKEGMLSTNRLDDLNLKKVEILKIDVEGFELVVLKGAGKTIERLGPKIILETHNRDLRKECDRFLVNLRYRLEITGRTIISTDGSEITNLFYARR